MDYSQKTLFLKSDSIGEGELGAMLIKGLLKAINEQKELTVGIVGNAMDTAKMLLNEQIVSL